MTELSLVAEIEVQNTLGEGIIWDHRSEKIWWTDIPSNHLYSWQFNGELTRYSTPEPLCSFGLTVDPDKLICAFASGFGLFQPSSETLSWIAKVDLDIERQRLNDGRVDRQGRFWAGGLGKSATGQKSQLFCLNDNQPVSHLTDISISNSLCWNLDSTRIYHADSPKQVIRKGSFDPIAGTVTDWQDFVQTPADAYPDGSCIDASDRIWNAQWGSAKVKCYQPDGKQFYTLDIPAKQPSCVSFGGPQLNYLFVTSARQEMDADALKEWPKSGNVFVYKTPFTGVRESIAYQPDQLNTK